METEGQEPRWVLPEEPTPVRLMATIWADTGGLHDDFASPADLDAWLDAVGVDREGVGATQQEFESARRLRDSVRRLAAHVTSDERPAAASAVTSVQDATSAVNEAADGRTTPRLRLNEGHLELAAGSAGSAVIGGLGEVASDAQHLLVENGSQLRACYAPGCVLYFVKTHPRREWCSVACGNRARAARHYQSVRSARGSQEHTDH
ncbi:MAG: ABATE domain-containing protein [Kineosporiaceae bacterium]|nr:ABATE domain-containing protein [Aeromicrobium sp.]